MNKLIILFAVICSAAALPAGEPYHFSYAVNDGDKDLHLSQDDTFDGDKVRGSYTQEEEGGVVRTVTYEADDENGYRAEVVRRLGSKVIERFIAGADGVVYPDGPPLGAPMPRKTTKVIKVIKGSGYHPVIKIVKGSHPITIIKQ